MNFNIAQSEIKDKYGRAKKLYNGRISAEQNVKDSLEQLRERSSSANKYKHRM